MADLVEPQPQAPQALCLVLTLKIKVIFENLDKKKKKEFSSKTAWPTKQITDIAWHDGWIGYKELSGNRFSSQIVEREGEALNVHL